MKDFSSLPDEILTDIFVKSENPNIFARVSKKTNKSYMTSRNSIYKQLFANNNIKVDQSNAFEIYKEMITVGTNFKKLYKFLNADMEDTFAEEYEYDLDALMDIYIHNNCINIIKLYMSKYDIFKFNDNILYTAINFDSVDIFDLFMSCNTMKVEYITNELFQVAACNSADILQLLIHKYKLDSTFNNYGLICVAIYKADYNIVDILLTDPKVDKEIVKSIITNVGETSHNVKKTFDDLFLEV